MLSVELRPILVAQSRARPRLSIDALPNFDLARPECRFSHVSDSGLAHRLNPPSQRSGTRIVRNPAITR